jgi:hypothetical protein
MTTEAIITNTTIRSRESIGPFKKLHVLCACCAFSGLIILIFAYRPLITKLHDATNRLRKVQIELLNQRSTIAASERSDVKGEIMRQNEVPLAIAELTERGRELGLDFDSISPGALVETTQAGIGKLPISFAIESEYKNVGQFLAYVEEYPRSVTEVTILSIRAHEENLSNLDVQLVLNLCVEIENATQ